VPNLAGLCSHEDAEVALLAADCLSQLADLDPHACATQLYSSHALQALGALPPLEHMSDHICGVGGEGGGMIGITHLLHWHFTCVFWQVFESPPPPSLSF